ncbi:hypothetical protein MPSEU_000510000 [Mayamaea pseudoterrestris]|nr:hypothetical protein MPSEU_000510000 [Mayamaea pseudoterrestris]
MSDSAAAATAAANVEEAPLAAASSKTSEPSSSMEPKGAPQATNKVSMSSSIKKSDASVDASRVVAAKSTVTHTTASATSSSTQTQQPGGASTSTAAGPIKGQTFTKTTGITTQANKTIGTLPAAATAASSTAASIVAPNHSDPVTVKTEIKSQAPKPVDAAATTEMKSQMSSSVTVVRKDSGFSSSINVSSQPTLAASTTVNQIRREGNHNKPAVTTLTTTLKPSQAATKGSHASNFMAPSAAAATAAAIASTMAVPTAATATTSPLSSSNVSSAAPTIASQQTAPPAQPQIPTKQMIVDQLSSPSMQLLFPSSKDSTNAPSTTSVTSTSTKDCVTNMIALLQAYGPLTAGQLEYNLPPFDNLLDVLQILVAVGVVHQVKDETDDSNASAVTGAVADATATATSITTPALHQTPARYCVGSGYTRVDPIMPETVVKEIHDAHEEIAQSVQRRQRLQKALMEQQQQSTNNASTANQLKQTLQQLLKDYPEIARDPVYVTALRLCHVPVDVGALAGGSASNASPSTGSGATAGGNTTKTAPKRIRKRKKVNPTDATAGATGNKKGAASTPRPNVGATPANTPVAPAMNMNNGGMMVPPPPPPSPAGVLSPATLAMMQMLTASLQQQAAMAAANAAAAALANNNHTHNHNNHHQQQQQNHASQPQQLQQQQQRANHATLNVPAAAVTNSVAAPSGSSSLFDNTAAVAVSSRRPSPQPSPTMIDTPAKTFQQTLAASTPDSQSFPLPPKAKTNSSTDTDKMDESK